MKAFCESFSKSFLLVVLESV